jgi:hypothetical protein
VRSLRATGAALIAALVVAPAAHAHGDPASHYLETDALYPSYARQPSQARQLELLGLLDAAAGRGYPIKVALVAGPEDLVDDLVMLRTPQRYAEKVATLIDHRLTAPVLIVTPYGTGVAGRASLDGRLRPVAGGDARALLDGIHVPRDADGDQLAAAATTAVRRIARAGGHALPAHVAPAKQYIPPPSASPASPARSAATAGGANGLAIAAPAILAALGMLVAFGRNLRRTRAVRAQRPAA